MTFAWYGHLRNLATLYMRQPVSRDYVYGALCVLGAAYFVFRSKG